MYQAPNTEIKEMVSSQSAQSSAIHPMPIPQNILNILMTVPILYLSKVIQDSQLGERTIEGRRILVNRML